MPCHISSTVGKLYKSVGFFHRQCCSWLQRSSSCSRNDKSAAAKAALAAAAASCSSCSTNDKATAAAAALPAAVAAGTTKVWLQEQL
ncbi:hypothetical protein ETH_00008135 [Eimeria tenella]|uniref:Uncharacterized protein n=1 Tax=Eimeria tenella TaxID=5802 RepID=U6KSD0_EIMTE|nr:hypothetical protein ETH_00008135 [Eimeria tenella]CDJ39838.1 hypothetical protein ETH_00008135 [Eimeria tenella]|eukprot:XP_013230591.1 hypothetical protein ETH_00008135 [Eimeria tenella]